MFLTGTFLRALDEKLRLAIPKKLRDAIGAEGLKSLYLAPGTDGSLALYPEAAFRSIADKLAQGSPTGQETRTFSRLFYAQAQGAELDRQGRVRLPSELAMLAGLEREVMLIGVGDHLEIWDRQRWEDYLQQRQPCYDQIAESAFGPPSKQPDSATTAEPTQRTVLPR